MHSGPGEPDYDGGMRKTKTMSASRVRGELDLVLDQVAREQTRVIIEKDGTPLAAIVGPEDLERLQRLGTSVEEALTRMRVAFSEFTEKQIMEDVAQVIEQVRADRRGQDPAHLDR